MIPCTKAMCAWLRVPGSAVAWIAYCSCPVPFPR
nr:MAG TPA: hypothetical protein [Caudoviricetes sp.]